ncbi:DegV family protein [Smaragdicoccus niigatensis]|uniref:DegV family protein n=1 Tax=Smaragdicoccus niigatensis TaxID=359359 RepID=UPI0020D18172|nr:DegV family protein [Smaragdicoccus niigatensis]
MTDTSANIDPLEAEQLGLIIVPLHVVVDGEELREDVDEVPDDIATRQATTAAASPGELQVAYRRALAASEGSGVVGIHISSGLSATYIAAKQVAGQFDGQVRVVDSKTAGLAVGFAALAAARAAQAGADLDEVRKIALTTAERSKATFMVDRLDHLRRGGRIGPITSFVGNALSMKPVLEVHNGKLFLAHKVRTQSKALAKLIDMTVEACPHGALDIGVQHVDSPGQAADLATTLAERLDSERVRIAHFGPSLAIHLGPGAVAVIVVPKVAE